MTVQELEYCCAPYKYVRITLKSGEKIAANTRCAKIAKKRVTYNPYKETNVEKVEPCSFHEYISYKVPFLRLPLNGGNHPKPAFA